MSLASDRYSFGVASARSVALGLGPVRFAIFLGGVGAGGLALYVGVPIAISMVVPILAIAYVWLPGGAGRKAHDTVRVGVAHQARRAAGSAKASAPLPAVALNKVAGQAWWPAELRDLRLDRVSIGGTEVGVVVSRRGPKLSATAVFAATGPPRYLLMDSAEQAGLVAGWSSVLSGLALERSRVGHLQWVERSTPASPELTGPSAPAGYRALVADVAGQAVEHHVYIAAEVRLGSDDFADAAAEWRLLSSRLAGASLAARPLGPDELAGLLRSWSDGRTGPAAWGQAGPSCWRETWREVETGGRFHRGYAVSAWPRVPVGPAWLEPLVVGAPAGVERVLSVHLEAVPHALAVRRLRSARTGHALEAEHRARAGMIGGAAERRQAGETDDREEELVAGYALYRAGGVVLVSATTVAGLDEASGEMLAQAAAASLDLRPLHGEHGAAWAATLPLCRLGWRRAS